MCYKFSRTKIEKKTGNTLTAPKEMIDQKISVKVRTLSTLKELVLFHCNSQ